MPKFIPLSTFKDSTFICDMCQQIKEPIFVTRNGYTELVIMSLEVYNTCKERALVALKDK
ncbi:MAG: hypothetical protein IJC78_05295 [Clostridia bacterium]|nr:hypothetical protein [Clostridia bacterium]